MQHLPERDRPPIKARLCPGVGRERRPPRARAGMLEAEKQFRKVIGYTQLPQLAIAIERRLHLHQPNTPTTPEAAIAFTV
jgi:hypothetical protein